MAVAVAVNAGCSLLLDTSGLEAPSPSDAGLSSAVDAADVDAGSASEKDASSPDSDAGVPCVGPTWFCDDFEGPLGATWSSNEAAGGAVTRVGDAKSGAFAMQAAVVNQPGSHYANLIKTLAFVPSRVACDFDLRVAALASPGETDVFDLTTMAGNTKLGLYLAAYDGKWGIYEIVETSGTQVVDRGATSATSPAIGEWTHVRIETDFTRVSLAFGGNIVATLEGLTPRTGATTSRLALGLPFVTNEQASFVQLDNFACALDP